MLTQKVMIQNKLGLHARTAAKLVDHASHYTSEIKISKGEQIINGKSIMAAMTLAAGLGTELEIETNGEDEQAMMDDLIELINNRFGED